MNEMPDVTRLEIVDYTPCKKCDGLGWFYKGEPINPKEFNPSFFDNDHTKRPKECVDCAGTGSTGRSVVFWDKTKQIELSLQDDGRTLKIFITKRGEQ